MYPWLPYWNAMFRLPWSGAVTQDINPVTDFFSPDVNIYAGDAGLETEITRKVASFGTQLGLLTEAVEELAAKVEADGPALDRLRDVAAEIEAVKAARRDDLEGVAIRALDALRAADDSAHARLLQQRLGKTAG